MKIINIERAGPHDDVIITMAFDRAATDVIKSLPSWARSWDSGAWRVHPAYAQPLAVKLHRLGFAIIFDDLDMFSDAVALDAVDSGRRSA